MGVNASFGSSLASEAPIADPAAEAMTKGATVHQSSLIRTAYVSELIAVPQNEEILFVPKITAGGVLLGSPISSAGNWMRPPPPTTASTQPATKAATISAGSDKAERFSAPRVSGVMHSREDLRERILDSDLDLLPTLSIPDFDQTARQATANDDDRRHAQDLRVGELDAWAHRPVIKQHRDASLLELDGEVGSSHTDHLFLAGCHHVHIERCQLARPAESL